MIYTHTALLFILLYDYAMHGKRSKGSLFSKQKQACAMVTGYEYHEL